MCLQILLTFFWVLLLGLGFWTLLRYTYTKGTPSQSLSNWPLGTKIFRNPSRATLILFAHPSCPCSKASVGELERLMPNTKEKIDAYVVFFKPNNQTNEWVMGDLWKSSQAIPGVKTLIDSQGTEMIRFGAVTSGQTFLYDENGKMVFQGGITPGRGHRGDGDGRRSILSFVETGTTKILMAPVFGCSLINPEKSVARIGQ